MIRNKLVHSYHLLVFAAQGCQELLWTHQHPTKRVPHQCKVLQWFNGSVDLDWGGMHSHSVANVTTPQQTLIKDTNCAIEFEL
jgi:hypothetical protein